MEIRLRRLIRALAVVLAASLVVLMVMLALYLGGEDAYFDDGASRWSHRISDEGNRATLWSAVGLSALALFALTRAVRSGRLRYALAGALLGTLGVVATTLTFVAFTAN